jgi:hypothetical protein
MGGIRRNVAVLGLAVSAFAGTACADGPAGPGALPSFAQLEIAGVRPSLVSAHQSGDPLNPLTGPSNASLLARAPGRDAFAIKLSRMLTPWLSLDFAGGLLRAHDADGNPMSAATHVFEQAGATLYPARGWNASLFVNSFRMRAANMDNGLQVANASFVNGRVNHDLSRNVRLSFDLLNAFDKRVPGIDPLATPRLWTDPLIAENVLFDASESRGFRLRLRVRF